VAIPETISASMAFLFLIVLSIRMYRESTKLAASNARFALCSFWSCCDKTLSPAQKHE
jgi:hypothetical protein